MDILEVYFLSGHFNITFREFFFFFFVKVWLDNKLKNNIKKLIFMKNYKILFCFSTFLIIFFSRMLRKNVFLKK